jgi:hypothetical protein
VVVVCLLDIGRDAAGEVILSWGIIALACKANTEEGGGGKRKRDHGAFRMHAFSEVEKANLENGRIAKSQLGRHSKLHLQYNASYTAHNTHEDDHCNDKCTIRSASQE